MLKNSVLCMVLILAGSSICMGQVLLPAEMNDPACRQLQQHYFGALKSVGERIHDDHFRYPFYLSTVLDIDQAVQPGVDERSIRFARFEDRRMLVMTGNYFASYSAKLMDPTHRARQTFYDVILPLLKAAVPPLASAEGFQGYAIEISHHVRAKVLGVMSENPENLVLVVSRDTAQKLVAAHTVEQQQAALLDPQTEVFFDGNPFLLWLRDDANPPDDWQPPQHAPVIQRKTADAAGTASDPVPAPDGDYVSPDLLQLPTPPVHMVDAKTVGELDAHYMDLLPTIVKDLDSQAHFVAYAPPGFISFRHAAYLQLAMTATIPSPASSQYRLAAIAFDQRVAHLVRPVLKYFPNDSDSDANDAAFDGIDFSVIVHTSAHEKDGSLAVEYFMPLKSLRCYADYDCTGQQILNSGIVLINGDRVSLDLQKAEDIDAVASR